MIKWWTFLAICMDHCQNISTAIYFHACTWWWVKNHAMIMVWIAQPPLRWRMFCVWHTMCCCVAAFCAFKYDDKWKICLESIHSTKIHCGFGVREITEVEMHDLLQKQEVNVLHIGHLPLITTLVWECCWHTENKLSACYIDACKTFCLANQVAKQDTRKWQFAYFSNCRMRQGCPCWLLSIHDIYSFILLLSSLAICQIKWM